MTNAIKIKVPATKVTTAIITNTNDKEIREINLLGKYSIARAKKHFNENKVDGANALAVLAVEKQVTCYEIELDSLVELLKKKGQIVILEPEK